ncbi:MAG: hypothetical protein AAF065_14775 [Verrucomicrobiota bacterium]
MGRKALLNIQVLIFTLFLNGWSADFFNFYVSEGAFNIDLDTKPDEVYFIESSKTLEDWTLIRAESANEPEVETSFSENTSTEISNFFRLTKKPIRETAPLITEFAFYAGIFHTNSDRRHRVRFHVDLELWNPYSFTLIADQESQSRAYFVIIENLPVVTVEIPSRNLSYSVDLNDFETNPPPGFLNWALPWVWVDVEDLEIPPGEVYFWSLDSTGVSSGLPRHAAPTEIRWSRRSDLSAIPGFPAFELTDEVVVTAAPSTISIHLIPFNDSWSELPHPLDFGETILSYENIPFAGFQIRMQASEYSRDTSSSYRQSDSTFGYHFRLRNPQETSELLPLIAPSSTSIDFSSEKFTNMLEVTNDPTELPNNPSIFLQFGTFYDSSPNSNDPPQVPIIVVD